MNLKNIIDEAFNAVEFAKGQERSDMKRKTGIGLAVLYGKMQDEIEAAKEKGATDKEIKQIEQKYQAKGLVLDYSKKNNGKDFTNAGTENVINLKNINISKNNLYKLLVRICELTGSQGNPSKLPEIKEILDKLKKQTEILIKYEERVSSKTYNPVGKKLKNDLEKIDINNLNWNEKSIPFTSDAANIKTGEFIKKDGKRTNDRYAEINAVDEKDAKAGKIDVSKIKSVNVTGKARPNAEVYEILLPYIQEFSRIKASKFNIPIEDLSSEKDTKKLIVKALSAAMLDDFLANKGKEAPVTGETEAEKEIREKDYKSRREIVKKIIDSNSDEDFEKNFSKFREMESIKDSNKGKNSITHVNNMAKKEEDKLAAKMGIEKNFEENSEGKSGVLKNLFNKKDKVELLKRKLDELKEDESIAVHAFGNISGVDMNNNVWAISEKVLTKPIPANSKKSAVDYMFSKEELSKMPYVKIEGQKYYIIVANKTSVLKRVCNDEEYSKIVKKYDRKQSDLKKQIGRIISGSTTIAESFFDY